MYIQKLIFPENSGPFFFGVSTQVVNRESERAVLVQGKGQCSGFLLCGVRA